MREYNFPLCRQQKQFEDLAKSIIRILAELQEYQQEDLHEYALQLLEETNDTVKRTWKNRR